MWSLSKLKRYAETCLPLAVCYRYSHCRVAAHRPASTCFRKSPCSRTWIFPHPNSLDILPVGRSKTFDAAVKRIGLPRYEDLYAGYDAKGQKVSAPPEVQTPSPTRQALPCIWKLCAFYRGSVSIAGCAAATVKTAFYPLVTTPTRRLSAAVDCVRSPFARAWRKTDAKRVLEAAGLRWCARVGLRDDGAEGQREIRTARTQSGPGPSKAPECSQFENHRRHRKGFCHGLYRQTGRSAIGLTLSVYHPDRRAASPRIADCLFCTTMAKPSRRRKVGHAIVALR